MLPATRVSDRSNDVGLRSHRRSTLANWSIRAIRLGASWPMILAAVIKSARSEEQMRNRAWPLLRDYARNDTAPGSGALKGLQHRSLICVRRYAALAPQRSAGGEIHFAARNLPATVLKLVRSPAHIARRRYPAPQSRSGRFAAPWHQSAQSWTLSRPRCPVHRGSRTSHRTSWPRHCDSRPCP